MRVLSHLILCRNCVVIRESKYSVKVKLKSDALELGQWVRFLRSWKGKSNIQQKEKKLDEKCREEDVSRPFEKQVIQLRYAESRHSLLSLYLLLNSLILTDSGWIFTSLFDLICPTEVDFFFFLFGKGTQCRQQITILCFISFFSCWQVFLTLIMFSFLFPRLCYVLQGKR